MPVKFYDYRIKVKSALNDGALQGLIEAAGEVHAKTVRNSRVDTAQLKNSWRYEVDESELIATIGSPLENALWEEFGTGEYAVNGDGRKGGWLVPTSDLTPKARRRMSGGRIKKGKKVFYFTLGKRPNRPLERAYFSKKEAVIKIIRRAIKNAMKGK